MAEVEGADGPAADGTAAGGPADGREPPDDGAGRPAAAAAPAAAGGGRGDRDGPLRRRRQRWGGPGRDGPGRRGGYQLVVQPDAPLDPRLAGQDVRLTVRAASSAGPVLAVPLSAVSATADGRTVVTVYENGQRRRVEVAPGTVGGGSAEIRPLVEDAVRPGDQVIVGVRDAGPRAGIR
ncbi:hypothetical protein [Kitasatospora sp. NPDC090091]|uniref:hypothetical protein n=1 Tax=Kitasatospora sp. NPDC090091 TaxID=3364081 RepID=UPI0037F4C09B